MATSRVKVDDRDRGIVYSGYEWDQEFDNDTALYDGTLTRTHLIGATATLVFNGTSVDVYGIIEPSGTTPPSSYYSIDGGTPQIYNAVMTANRQYQVQFFASPQLLPGQHRLIVTNVMDGDVFCLDYFLISKSSTAASKTSLGPIVGGVLGGIALIINIMALIFFLRRGGRKMQGQVVDPLPPGPPLGVTPFPPSPYVSQSKGPEPSAVPHGRFGQQLPANGHTGVAFPAHLPLAQIIGKRQVTAPDDRSASSAGLLDAHQREEERLDGNATPPPGTTGTSHRRSNGESHRGGSNGSSYPEESPPPY